MVLYKVLFTFLSQLIGVFCGDFEKKLYDDLLRNYNPLVRPVRNETEPVLVSLGMDFQQIVDIIRHTDRGKMTHAHNELDELKGTSFSPKSPKDVSCNLEEKTQIMITNVWLRLDWRDIYLEWDPQAYGGVAEVRLPITSIWKPDILLYNSADTQFDSTWPTNAVVYSTGDINWIPPGIIKSTCKIDVAWFPFDDQHCKLKFGSWTYSGGQIDLRNGTVGLDTYTTNGEWKLMSINSVRSGFKYECCPDPYYDVTFTVWVRRRTLYYTLNLVVPSTMISAMTLLGFTLPPESGEKLTLGVTIFMSLCVFLLMAAEAMPQTSEAVPLISTYFSCIMVVVSASVVFTVLVLNYHHRSPDTHEMSPFVHHLFLEWLPWLLMMQRPGEPTTSSPSKSGTDRGPTNSSTTSNHHHNNVAHTSDRHLGASKSLLANVLDLEDGSTENRTSTVLRYEPTANNISVQHSNSVPPQYEQCTAGSTSRLPPAPAPAPVGGVGAAVLRELRFITERMRQEDEDEQVKCDWRFAAMVVDRMCLIMFTTFLVISTAGILFSAPHISA